MQVWLRLLLLLLRPMHDLLLARQFNHSRLAILLVGVDRQIHLRRPFLDELLQELVLSIGAQDASVAWCGQRA